MDEYVRGVYEVPKLNNIEKIKSYRCKEVRI